MAKPIIPVVNRGDVLGQGGSDLVTNATVSAHTYIAITPLVGNADAGEHHTCTVTAVSEDTNDWDSLSSLEVPVGTTIYGRWSSVTIASGDTAMVYRG
jgi:hypothetical protein